MQENVWIWKTQVFLRDMDFFKNVYYLKYVEWCNQARDIWMLNFIPKDHEEYILCVLEINHKFENTCTIGDEIQIEVNFDNIKRTNFRMNFDIFKINNNEKIYLGKHYQRIVYMNKDSKVTRVSETGRKWLDIYKRL